jgi:hypothetical protein
MKPFPLNKQVTRPDSFAVLNLDATDHTCKILHVGSKKVQLAKWIVGFQDGDSPLDGETVQDTEARWDS